MQLKEQAYHRDLRELKHDVDTGVKVSGELEQRGYLRSGGPAVSRKN